MAVRTSKGTPQTIGKYDLRQKIGEGSMATVYKALDRASGEAVAIKVASRRVQVDEVLRQRFEQEYRTASSLSHPHLVRALDFGEDDSTLYLVLEFVDGPDLWQRIEREGRLPEAEAVRLIVQVAQGLHEAHKHGIIHRDIKPENILITPDGQAKLTDLGLVKDLEEDLGLTQLQKGLGTPNFIAPEQFTDAKHAGVRCDLYALAATLYMAVTGEIPFPGDDLSKILSQKRQNKLRPPRQLVPGLSERLDWTIRRTLQAEAKQRYASCPEFIAALTGEGAEATQAKARLAAAGQPKESAKRSAQDRRAWVRYACSLDTTCNLNVSVHPQQGGVHDRWPATVHDLSVGGIGLHLSRRFEPGTVLTVELQSSDQNQTHILEMRVTHVKRAGRGQWFVGASFAETLGKEALRKLL
jgi:serine/threonine protein kinase